MAKVQEITVWGSGVVQDKEARDVAQCIAAAASREGKYVQAFDNYVDLPDRVNVPVRKYARISDSEIEEKYLYENHSPEISIVIQSTLVKGVNVLKGMAKGGYLIVNTDKSPDYIEKFIPNKDILKAIGTIDASKLGAKATIDFSATEGGSSAVGIGAGIGAIMAGAAARVSNCVKIESLYLEVADPEAAKHGFEAVTIKKLK